MKTLPLLIGLSLIWLAIGIALSPAADVGLSDAERASIEQQIRARGYVCDRLTSLERMADDPSGALIFRGRCGSRVYRGAVADVSNVAGSIAIAPWTIRGRVKP